MRIVIDMQGAQTESRFRGIGRYTVSFAQAVVRNRDEHEVYLALSGLFPDTIEPIRAAFDGLLPQENIRVWHAPGPVSEDQPDNAARREVAELLREAFLANLQPDVIHMSSLFEGYVDDAVTSVGRFDQRTQVSVSLYDLIPLLNPDHYLKPNPNYAKYYQRKLEYVKQASVLLSISGHSRQEGLAHLAKPADSIVNVSTAIEQDFQPIQIDDATATKLRNKFGLVRPFVMYTGGADDRKNLPRLIRAYAALSAQLRAGHQLLLAGRMPEGNIAEFKHIGKSAGLQPDEVCFTGYVSDDELIQLYNLCKLFVFPSWHEGFGLPALEAMACGAPVIAANTTSLPEVIGLDAGMFDPHDATAMAAKMTQALEDDTFLALLRAHGLQQVKKFSWDKTAAGAIAAWASLQAQTPPSNSANQPNGRKLQLAFVSPLPPERTGIADYSAELLPALAAHYDIELVVAQHSVDATWGSERFRVRDVAWLRENAKSVDRVLYHLGNSPFHQHMLPLLHDIPGTVVLHDFYMSGQMAWLEQYGGISNAWTNALYAAHGYGAVEDRYSDAEDAKRKYPVNWDILQHAQGVIVHSEYSRSLAQQWYGNQASKAWRHIPLLRAWSGINDKRAVRKQLGIDEHDFVVCSFGFLDSTKLNHRLLDAWLNSALASDLRCRLIFVGQNNGGDYGVALLKTKHQCHCDSRISITGFAAPELFRQYLVAADLAVQLRTQSRGETSAAVLDCMNYELPLIVNSNGSMAELDSDAVWVLPDEFTDSALIEALEALWLDPVRRQTLGARASSIIHDHHAPEKCALQYAAAIEYFHHGVASSTPALISAIAAQKNFMPDDTMLIRLSSAIASNLPLPQPARRLFLDVTATCRNDLKTGIERVARALTVALLESPPAGYRIEPVYLSDNSGVWHYRYARSYTLGLLGCPTDALVDEPVSPFNGDVLLTLDLSGGILVAAEQAGLFRNYRQQGVSVYATVFDLLPVQLPNAFPPDSDQNHQRWLQAISQFDGAVCISGAVADDLRCWQAATGLKWENRRTFSVDWFHLGADVKNSAPSRGMPSNAVGTLQQLKVRPSFLMVGTIEPRKAYLQTLEAFDHLWRKGVDVNLVIVGHEGWKGLPREMRRDIPQTVERLQNHPELGKKLFWLDGISDEYLDEIYSASTCLIAASEGEGFGLPLIEAAQHKLPLLLRDIPVFREVAADFAYYFVADTSEELASSVAKWLQLFGQNNYPKVRGMRWLTWAQSADQLLSVVLKKGECLDAWQTVEAGF